MTPLFNLSLAGYFTALLLAAANLFAKQPRKLAFAATTLLSAGLVAQTGYIILRWIAAGRAPFSNMFESLVLFAWAIVAVYLRLQVRLRLPWLAAATALLALLSLAYASSFESDIKPLMPALRSNWLAVHVFTCFLGYGAFAVAFASSIAYIIAVRKNGKALPETRDGFEAATAKSISFGFLFLTIGIIGGAVWANSAWGSYWQWDPKETWSLITWFIYAVFLHCRFMRGWKGKRAAWISIIGFASVVFTYVGVNFLLSGLHSYASS
jgi:cytochrome c-type biogenesis protein CcsB